MAGCAVLIAYKRMIEEDDAEITGVDVAGAAGSGVMVFGWCMAIYTILCTNDVMVEVDLLPGTAGMARSAVAAVKTLVCVIFGVAGNTFGRCATVCIACMAGGTSQIAMSTR